MNKKKIISIILTIICLTSIFVFSNMSGKSSNFGSQKVLEKVVKITNKDEKRSNSEIANEYNQLFRKIAHAVEYVVLAIIVMNFLDCYDAKILKRCVFTMLICGACSLVDEFHQYFVNARTASIMDCLIDSVGALMGIGIYMLIHSTYCLIREIITMRKEKNINRQ